MKRLFFLIPMLLLHFYVQSQTLYLKISGSSSRETKIIDSISYFKKHPDVKSIVSEINLLNDKLLQSGFIENEILENAKRNDSTFYALFKIGKQTKNIHIYISRPTKEKTAEILDFEKDTIIVEFSRIQQFLNSNLTKLEQKGYSLANLKLQNFSKKNNLLFAELKIDIGTKRQLNDIVYNGYEKFPEGHKKNIRRLYRNKTFNQETLKKLHADFEKFRFVSQTKYPEILFTKDTTKVYLYLEKAKSNKFEGFIGFTNDDESSVNFNGYLDLLLVNALNTGEEFTLYWKSDGNEQRTFNAAIELPYIFRSRFGLKAALNIFKQDSTFQNTRTAIDLGYYFNYNTRLYVGYQSTESSDIQNTNSSSISDYENKFITSDFEFVDYKTDDFLFPEKTRISIKGGFGSRTSKITSEDQYFISTNLMHNFYLDRKNSFNIRSQNYYLKSDTYIINELHRFGGINSIRGFNENSLQANLLTSILSEYRYALASNLYIHTITDYAYFRDESTNNSGKLLGIGFGFGLLTKNGLLNLVYANGTIDNQAIKFANSIVHISFKTNF